jgi:hypothetical protein
MTPPAMIDLANGGELSPIACNKSMPVPCFAPLIDL